MWDSLQWTRNFKKAKATTMVFEPLKLYLTTDLLIITTQESSLVAYFSTERSIRFHKHVWKVIGASRIYLSLRPWTVLGPRWPPFLAPRWESGNVPWLANSINTIIWSALFPSNSASVASLLLLAWCPASWLCQCNWKGVVEVPEHGSNDVLSSSKAWISVDTLSPSTSALNHKTYLFHLLSRIFLVLGPVHKASHSVINAMLWKQGAIPAVLNPVDFVGFHTHTHTHTWLILSLDWEEVAIAPRVLWTILFLGSAVQTL